MCTTTAVLQREIADLCAGLQVRCEAEFLGVGELGDRDPLDEPTMDTRSRPEHAGAHDCVIEAPWLPEPVPLVIDIRIVAAAPDGHELTLTMNNDDEWSDDVHPVMDEAELLPHGEPFAPYAARPFAPYAKAIVKRLRLGLAVRRDSQEQANVTPRRRKAWRTRRVL